MNNSNKQLDKLIELFNSSLFEEALDYGLNLSENNPNNPISDRISK